MYTVNAIRNVCLLGHSGSGKSALAESLLYMTGAIDRIGKNADGNTVCDYDPEEIRRHISISTSVVPLEYKNTKMKTPMTFSDFTFGDDFYAIGCRQGDKALAAKISEAIGLLIENGKAAEISEKWFGTNIVILEGYGE